MHFCRVCISAPSSKMRNYVSLRTDFRCAYSLNMHYENERFRQTYEIILSVLIDYMRLNCAYLSFYMKIALTVKLSAILTTKIIIGGVNQGHNPFRKPIKPKNLVLVYLYSTCYREVEISSERKIKSVCYRRVYFSDESVLLLVSNEFNWL